MQGETIRTLEQIRDDLALSQSELARRVGVSRPMISRYERGKAEPSVTVAARYAEELGITISELIQLLRQGA